VILYQHKEIENLLATVKSYLFAGELIFVNFSGQLNYKNNWCKRIYGFK